MNRFAFEIVAERKVAEHFEERMVIGRDPHIPDVARSQTFLAGRGLGEVQRADSQELVLELIHPGGREQDCRIVSNT